MTTYNLKACHVVSGAVNIHDGIVEAYVHCTTHDWQVTWRQQRTVTPSDITGDHGGSVISLQSALERRHTAIVERYRAQAKHVHAQLDQILQDMLGRYGPDWPEALLTVGLPPA